MLLYLDCYLSPLRLQLKLAQLWMPNYALGRNIIARWSTCFSSSGFSHTFFVLDFGTKQKLRVFCVINVHFVTSFSTANPPHSLSIFGYSCMFVFTLLQYCWESLILKQILPLLKLLSKGELSVANPNIKVTEGKVDEASDLPDEFQAMNPTIGLLKIVQTAPMHSHKFANTLPTIS